MVEYNVIPIKEVVVKNAQYYKDLNVKQNQIKVQFETSMEI